MIVTQFSAGPTIGSTLIRSVVDSVDERFVFVQYLPINRVLSDTEYKSALRSVQLVIQLIKPRLILSLDDDYMKYMTPSVYEQYKTKFVIVNKGLATVGRPSCELIDRIAKRTYQPDAPIYILRDDNSAHNESARALGACLKEFGHDVDQYQANTLAELKTNLFDISSKPKGFLISLINTVSDTEYNVPVGLDAINRLIIKINKRHIDVGFVRAQSNLSLVIVPTVGGIDANEKVWSDIRTTPHLYVSPQRLDNLGASLVYKNMFQEIGGVLDK